MAMCEKKSFAKFSNNKLKSKKYSKKQISSYTFDASAPSVFINVNFARHAVCVATAAAAALECKFR